MNKILIQKLNKILGKNQVILAYLFGSAAEEKLTPLSDVDIAILFSEKVKEKDHFDKELNLASEIGSLFKIDKVDVINLKTIRDPLLKHNAVFKGKTIFVKNKKLKFKIEKQIMKEYEDTKYLRKTAYKIMEKQIKKGTFGKPIISIYSKSLKEYVSR